MQEVWFAETKNEEDREKVRQDLGIAYNAFQRLRKILNQKKKKYSSDYDTANWAYLQADTNGYNRAIDEVLTLIDMKDK